MYAVRKSMYLNKLRKMVAQVFKTLTSLVLKKRNYSISTLRTMVPFELDLQCGV